MFTVLLIGLLFIGIIGWIILKLKNWKQWLLFLFVIFIGIPALLWYWFHWGYQNSERKLKKAAITCRQEKTVDQLNIYFDGFTAKDLADSCFTIHSNAMGQVLDNNKQKVGQVKKYENTLSAAYSYPMPFQVDDVLEIRVGDKKYVISNFVLTASANYTMGGAIISGCRIDSANINGQRTAFDKNMILHKTDDY